MNKIKNFGLAILVGAAMLSLLFNFRQPEEALGSVADGQGYFATTTVGMAVGERLVKTGPATIGSIIVSSSSAGTLKVWNATSTTDTASTTVATFIASPANGTYTFDVDLSRGLSITLGTGFKGSYTITYR